MLWIILVHIFVKLIVPSHADSEESVVLTIELEQVPATVWEYSLLFISYYPVGELSSKSEDHLSQYEEIATDLTSLGIPSKFGIAQVPTANYPYLMFYAYGYPVEPSYLGEMNKDILQNWIITQVNHNIRYQYEKKLTKDDIEPVYVLSGGTLDDDILVLKKENFDREIKKNLQIVVLFYSLKDSASKALIPIYRQLAKQMSTVKSTVKFAQVDALKNKQILFTRTSASGETPILAFYKNGKEQMPFKGKMDIKDIIKWIRNQSTANGVISSEPHRMWIKPFSSKPAGNKNQPKITEQPDLGDIIDVDKGNLQKVITKYPNIVIFFHHPEDSTWETFYPVLKEIILEVRKRKPTVKLGKVDLHYNYELIGDYYFMALPILYFYKNGQRLPYYTGALEAYPILKWIYEQAQDTGGNERNDRHQMSDHPDINDILLVNKRSLEKEIAKYPNMVIFFHYPDQPSWSMFNPVLNKIISEVRKRKPTVKLGKVNLRWDSELIREYSGPLPLLVYYKKGRKLTPYSGVLGAKAILKWIYDHAKDTATNGRKDHQELPEQPETFSTSDVLLVDKSSLLKVISKYPYVVIFFHYLEEPSWKLFHPVLNTIIGEVRKRKLTVKIGKINLRLDYKMIEGYYGPLPLVVFYKNGRQLAPYKGVLGANAIVNWISNHAQDTGTYGRNGPKKLTFSPHFDGVLLVDKDSLKSVTSKHPNLVIFFHYPDEPSWQTFYPVLDEIMRKVKVRKPKIKLAKVDLLWDYEMIGGDYFGPLPLVVFYKNGKKLPPYKGTLGTKALLQWMYAQAGDNQTTEVSDVIKLKSKSHFDKIIRENEFVVMANYPKSCCWQFYQIYKEIAKEVKSRVYSVIFTELRDAFEPDGDETEQYIYVVFYKHGKRESDYNVLVKNADKGNEKRHIIKWIIDEVRSGGVTKNGSGSDNPIGSSNHTRSDAYPIAYSSKSVAGGSYPSPNEAEDKSIPFQQPGSSLPGGFIAADNTNPFGSISFQPQGNSAPRGFISGDSTYKETFTNSKQVNDDAPEVSAGSIEVESDYFIPFKKGSKKVKMDKKQDSKGLKKDNEQAKKGEHEVPTEYNNDQRRQS